MKKIKGKKERERPNTKNQKLGEETERFSWFGVFFSCILFLEKFNMSNWLGFSLTPHLRIDEGFWRDEQQNQQQEGGGFVMPLLFDDSLCDMDPFRRPSGSEDWIYETEIRAAAAADLSREAPKLEDFLGCCYSNSSDDNRVNINVPPSFNSTGEIERDPPQQIHPYPYHHHHHQYS